MSLEISTQHVELTASLKEYIGKKFDKFYTFFDNIQDISVCLKVSHSTSQGDQQTVDVDIFASGVHIHASHTTGDLYASIDAVSEKCETQLKKHKEKLRDNHHREAQLNTHRTISTPAPQTPVKENFDEDKLYIRKPMTPEDALEVCDDDAAFFVFHNSKTKKVNVLYRIQGNAYGLIETE